MITRDKILRNETFWTETIQNKIYNDLIEYIEQNNLSQKDIAEKLSVSKGYISQILNGENLNFRINTLVKICLAIGKVPNIEFEDIEVFSFKDSIDSNGAILANDNNKVNYDLERIINLKTKAHSSKIRPLFSYTSENHYVENQTVNSNKQKVC